MLIMMGHSIKKLLEKEANMHGSRKMDTLKVSKCFAGIVIVVVIIMVVFAYIKTPGERLVSLK